MLDYLRHRNALAAHTGDLRMTVPMLYIEREKVDGS